MKKSTEYAYKYEIEAENDVEEIVKSIAGVISALFERASNDPAGLRYAMIETAVENASRRLLGIVSDCVQEAIEDYEREEELAKEKHNAGE